MTTDPALDVEQPTRAELRDAIHDASIAHKRTILRGTSHVHVAQTAAFLAALIEQYEDLFDTAPPIEDRVDNSYDPRDVTRDRGFHLITHAGSHS